MKNLWNFLAAMFFILLLAGCKKNEGSTAPIPDLSAFFHANGNEIVDGNNKSIYLDGVAFGNNIWTDEIPITHHSEIDYTRVKDMGMNIIRFYLNYKTFEDDNNPYTYKQEGWDWIDQNIAWAKKNGIYLVLNMHAPQGGYQSQGTGDALWTDIENQNRLTALWKAIAERYKREFQIIGFGLVNEPVPTSDISQWQQLAQRITNEIRAVDKNHIVVVERAIYVKGKEETIDYNFPTIVDNNLVYEFHIYDPLEYTHQLFSWTNLGDGGKYPDETIIAFSNSEWYTATFNNPLLKNGNSNWKYFEGVKYKIADTAIKLAVPALVGANATGRVYFDKIEINEYDANGNFTRKVLEMNLDNLDGWGYWSANQSGNYGLSQNTGADDMNSLFIENATADCNLSNYSKAFQPIQNYSYQINGWMKGNNIANTASCMLRIDFLTSNSVIQTRNKAYLTTVVSKYTDWGKKKNRPVYMGEFGAGYHCFQNEKGGLQWVEDMLDISKSLHLPFTYHVYHEDNFGIYYGYGSIPDPANANQPLIDLFTEKLN